MFDSNNQNALQLPFEYHHLPDFAEDLIKSGEIVSADASIGLVICLCTKGSIDIESGLNYYCIKEKEMFFFYQLHVHQDEHHSIECPNEYQILK